MAEYIVTALVIVFIVLPCVASTLTSSFSSYKDDLILGNSLALGGFMLFIVALVILTSIFHVFDDGPSLSEVINKLINLKGE